MNLTSEYHSPFVDLGITRTDLESYLATCGYWSDETRRTRYAYELSPSAYVLSSLQRTLLERLAHTTYKAVEMLAIRLATIGLKKSPSTHEEGRLMNLARGGARHLLRPYDGISAIPPVIKVDLMQGADGGFYIAEVDVYNPRGLGFIALLEGSVPPMYYSKRLPGMDGLAKLLLQNPQFSILISEFERFYEPSYQIFADMMNAHYGASIRVVRELRFDADEHNERLLIIPDTLDKAPALRELLMERYHAGTLKTLFPPTAYLGSKAFLPWLAAEPGMDEFMPTTTLVGKGCKDPFTRIPREKPTVLKAAVSSGLKHVFFSDLDRDFAPALQRASDQKNPSWILQEQVKQAPCTVTVFDREGNRERRAYYLRVTAYIACTGLIDVEVTGRPDPKVHGAPDCIMVPVILG
ncbi:MAG: hypothetical protein WBK28_03825 [Minisyncoccia bacterium]